MQTVQKIDLAAIAKKFRLPISADGKEILVPRGTIRVFGETEFLCFVTTEPFFPFARLRHVATQVFVSTKNGGTFKFSPEKLGRVLEALGQQ